MDNMLLLAMGLSFILSFLFALGGVGAAIALIPALSSFTLLPLQTIKPIALLSNTLSMTGATINNIKNKRLDWKAGFPIIIASMLLAPVGAYSSKFIDKNILIFLFILFLFFSAGMMLFYKKQETYNEQPFNKLYLIGVGSFAGALSGLLGVGGGSIIMPLLAMKGYNSKKVATITAFVVPFSSFTGFLAYISIGKLNYQYLLFCSITAFIGGAFGTIVMQKYTKPKVVKKILVVLLLIMAVKMISKLI